MLKLQDLVVFLEGVKEDLDTSLYKGRSQDTIILLQSIKVSEELGELHNEVLKLFKSQREEKMNKNSVNLANELSDVILSSLLLGIELNIDIEKALTDKIDIIKQRHIK